MRYILHILVTLSKDQSMKLSSRRRPPLAWLYIPSSTVTPGQKEVEYQPNEHDKKYCNNQGNKHAESPLYKSQ